MQVQYNLLGFQQKKTTDLQANSLQAYLIHLMSLRNPRIAEQPKSSQNLIREPKRDFYGIF